MPALPAAERAVVAATHPLHQPSRKWLGWQYYPPYFERGII